MIEDRLKKTAILTGLFVALSLGVMFFRAATKSVIIAEAGDEIQTNSDSIKQYELKIQKPTDSKGKGTLVIPLESGVASEDIQFVEKTVLHQFVLFIKGRNANFYNNNGVITDLECIQACTIAPINDKGTVCMTFQLNGLYDTETSLGDREIVVNFNEPDYENKKIVVIDPVDEVGVKLVPYLKTAFGSDENIKLYFTSYDDNLADKDETFSLINDAHADLYIQLGVDETTESDQGVRTYYNDRFFIRGFGNVQLADKLERYVASASGGTALGLAAAEAENEKIAETVIPSAFVALGNISNRVDNENLEKDSYIEKCATGVADGIRAAFKETTPVSDEPEPDAH